MRLRGFPPDGVPAVSYVGSPTGSLIGTADLPVGHIISIPGAAGPQGDDGPPGRSVVDVSASGNDLVFLMSDSTTERATVPALAGAAADAERAELAADLADAYADLAVNAQQQAQTSATAAQASADAAEQAVTGMQSVSEKGQPGGYAPLDGSAMIPSTYLPSYVDDVVEAPALTDFPTTGEGGKIYVAVDTGLIYRWSGTAYVEISPSPGSTDSVPEGAVNLYFTPARVRAMIGTTTGTLCEGNDPRLSNSRPPTAHTHTISEVDGLQAALNSKADVVYLTQAQYDALGAGRPSTTLYVIVG